MFDETIHTCDRRTDEQRTTASTPLCIASRDKRNNSARQVGWLVDVDCTFSTNSCYIMPWKILKFLGNDYARIVIDCILGAHFDRPSLPLQHFKNLITLLMTFHDISVINGKALRETQTLRARACCSKVRTPPASAPVANTNTQTGQITIHCAAASQRAV